MSIGFSLYILSQIASAYVQNLYLFLLLYGVLAGIGLGMNVILIDQIIKPLCIVVLFASICRMEVLS